MAFAITSNVSANVAAQSVQEAAQEVRTNNQNEGSIFESESEREDVIKTVMEHTNGTDMETAKAIVDSADSYAASTLKNAADKDKGISEAEWVNGRSGYIGANEEEMSKIFQNMDIDGDGHLDGHELFAAQLFKDVTSDYKDGNIENLDRNNYTIDGKINVSDDKEHMASNMKALLNDEGKSIMQDMYAISFGEKSANVKSATGVYRETLRSAAYDEDFKNNTPQEREEFVQGWGEVYANSMDKTYTKYADSDGFVYQDGLQQMIEDYAKANPNNYVGTSEANIALTFLGADTDGDGRLSFEEMSAFSSHIDGEMSFLAPALDVAARQNNIDFTPGNTLTDYYNRAAEGTDDTFLRLVGHFRNIYSSINVKYGLSDNAEISNNLNAYTKAEWYAQDLAQPEMVQEAA